MCTNTSLSHFLEGVCFTDEEVQMQLEAVADDDLLYEDGGLFLLDMDVDEPVEHALLQQPRGCNGRDDYSPVANEMELAMSDLLSVPASDMVSLPPLEFATSHEDDDDLVALMAVQDDDEDDDENHSLYPTQDYSSSSSSSGRSRTASLEKLAHALRQSEMALREQQQRNQTKLVGEAPHIFSKASLLFQGQRVTITPELEKSRQEVWAIIRAQQQQQQQQRHCHSASAVASSA